jgi:hypothetical protein
MILLTETEKVMCGASSIKIPSSGASGVAAAQLADEMRAAS